MCVHPFIKEINGKLTPLPCGKCIECRKTYQRDWTFRLKTEVKNFRDYWWLTLTYNNEHLPTISVSGVKQSVVKVPEVQQFLKRLRQRLNYPRLKYFAVGEYGGKHNRAHYHLLFFCDSWQNVHQAYVDTLAAWSPDGDTKGFVYVRRGLDKHIHYVTKYVNKLDSRHHYAKPFKCMSRSLGIDFLTPSMIHFFLENPCRQVHMDSKTFPLPRYYVKKLDTISEYSRNINFPYIRYGLKFSDVCRPCRYNSDSPRWYHDYFCDNYSDIREDFIQSELDNDYITKFLEPTENIVFDWYLHKCKVTRDAILRSDELLDKVKIKNCSECHSQPIGEYRKLNYDEDDFE